jgi:hypothetical protein
MTESITIRQAIFGEGQLLSDLAFRSKAYWGYSSEFMEACQAELTVSESDSIPGRYLPEFRIVLDSGNVA